MATKVLCIGDVMLDVVTKIAVMPSAINYGSDTASEISTHGGGAAGNVASWLTRTNSEATIVGHVGDDAAGAALISEFDSLGVHHQKLIIEGARSGVVVVLVDPTGERTMFPDNGYSPLDPSSLPGIKEMIAEIRAAKIPIYFDPASVGAMKEIDVEEVKSWLPHFDCLLLNEEEAIYLTGESDLEKALDALLVSCATVVIKRGSQGAVGKIRGGQSISVNAVHADVVDTTGAGDSFAAGFISEFTQTHDLHRSLSAGAAIAARCVSIIGARPRVGTEV